MANLTEKVESQATNNQGFSAMLEATSHDIGARLGAAMSDATDRADEYVSSTRHYVQGNPIQSVVIAAATGLVIGGILALATTARKRHA